MNNQPITKLMHQQLLPIIKSGRFHLLPSPERLVSNSTHYEPIFPYTLHSHSFFEWVWCVENQAFLKIRNQVYQLEVGDICLLPPGEMHTEMFYPAQHHYQVLWCGFKNETIGAHLHAYAPVNHLRSISGISAPAPPYTNSLLGALQHELKTKQPYRESISTALVESLAHLMLRAFETSAHTEQQNFIPGKIAVKVNHYLNQHFHEPLTLADVARALHVSRNYLATLYKQETGTTIGQMLKQIRLEHAKKMLLETHLSVHEISKAVGYANAEHFSRIFGQQEGVSPGRYGKG